MGAEADIEKHLVKMVKAFGGTVRKARWIGVRGCPDRLVIFPALKRAAWVELKAPGETPRHEQQREAELLVRGGMHHYVIDSTDLVNKFIGTMTTAR